MEPNDCVVRIQFYDRAKYVAFNKKDVGNWQNFISEGKWNLTSKNIEQKNIHYVSIFRAKIPALSAFDIDKDSIGSVMMWDSNDTPISPEIFHLVVLQFLHCSNFSIKLGLASDPNEPLLVHVSTKETFFFSLIIVRFFYRN